MHSLARLLEGHHIVIWWNWGLGLPPDILDGVRSYFPFPQQIWVLIDWDEPYAMFVSGRAQSRKHLWDVVFASATSVLDTFRVAGAIEVHAFVPASDDVHYPDPDREFRTDVAFVATRLYSEPGYLANRSAVLEALGAAADRGEFTLGVWGTPEVGSAAPRHFRGAIRYQENRKVWSSAKISLDLHAVGGFGGWYVNQRVTEVLASGGLLLVDDSAEGPLTDMEDCVILRDLEPDAIVAKVKEILENYEYYEPIRKRGLELVQRAFSSRELALRVASAAVRARTNADKKWPARNLNVE